MKYRIRAYQMGVGEICCASTESLASGKLDSRQLLRRPGRILTKLEIRDRRQQTGWRLIQQESNY